MKKKTALKRTRDTHDSVESRLLETAGRCFMEEGFGFGIDDILAESKVAKMSLYAKFQSKYGLIERLLDDCATEWEQEIDRLAADNGSVGTEKIVSLLTNVCKFSRDPVKRTGLIGQALVEFPPTGKLDEVHSKKDAVHAKAQSLQRQLLRSLEKFCKEAGLLRPAEAATEILLLASGYFVSEPALGKTKALKVVSGCAHRLIVSQ